MFLAATAALEVQMLVRVCVCVCVTLVTTVLKLEALKFLDCRTSEGLLKDFWRISEGLSKDFQRTYKSQPPGLRDLLETDVTNNQINTTNTFNAWAQEAIGWKVLFIVGDFLYLLDKKHSNLWSMVE